MEQLDDLLAGVDVALSDDVLDRIDEIVPPGTDVGTPTIPRTCLRRFGTPVSAAGPFANAGPPDRLQSGMRPPPSRRPRPPRQRTSSVSRFGYRDGRRSSLCPLR